MPATVTLSTTTLSDAVDSSSNQIKLTSVSGVLPGTRLFMDRELMRVTSLGLGTTVNVVRGMDGTGGSAHSSGVTIYIGDGHQFYSKDPVGRPPVSIAVSPWINVRNGNVWFAQGDTTPETSAVRWWQAQTTVFDTGALGVRTVARNPESST